jgi:hypothetical protein
MSKHIRTKQTKIQIKIIGILFTIVGGFLFVSGIFLLLAPDSTMICNGEKTSSLSCKFSFTLFTGLFFIIGLVALFSNQKLVNKLSKFQESLLRIRRRSRLELILFLVTVICFVWLGEAIGWRLVGIYQLIFSMKIIRERTIGYGWQGYEPSGFIKGPGAIIIGLISLGISIMLLFFPESTVMRLGGV